MPSIHKFKKQKAIKPSTNQLINSLIHQALNHSIDKTNNQSIKQSNNQPINQSNIYSSDCGDRGFIFEEI